MVVQEREVDADEGTGGEIEEAHEAVEVRVARVEAMALWQHRPSTRVETRVEDAAALGPHGACAPVGADGAEPDVVLQVAGQKNPPPNQLHQIPVQRRPIQQGHLAGVTAAHAAELAVGNHDLRQMSLLWKQQRQIEPINEISRCPQNIYGDRI